MSLPPNSFIVPVYPATPTSPASPATFAAPAASAPTSPQTPIVWARQSVTTGEITPINNPQTGAPLTWAEGHALGLREQELYRDFGGVGVPVAMNEEQTQKVVEDASKRRKQEKERVVYRVCCAVA